MSLHVDVQSASNEPVPAEEDIRRWIAAALEGAPSPEPMQQVEVSVRLVDLDEMAQLNENFRGKKGATNVLAFPAELPDELSLPLLGDIVICAPVVRSEAAQQGKSATAHWAHMTVHGTLHLLGYDHIDEADASVMESLESAILAGLNFRCPYEFNQPHEHSQ